MQQLRRDPVWTRAPAATGRPQRALLTGLLVALVLGGCVWADPERSPLLPEAPVPDAPMTEAPVPEAPTPEAPVPAPSPDESIPQPPPSGDSTVVFSVEGAGTASVTYMAVHGAGVVQQSVSATDLPFTRTITVRLGGAAAPASMTLAAVGNQDAGTLSCTITADGVILAEQTSTGPSAAVTCTATSP